MKQHRNTHSRKKTAALLVSLVLVLTAVLGATIAYLSSETPSVTNTFEPASVSCRIEETFNEGNTAKTGVTVTNTGNIPAYIRVAVVANKVDGEGNLIAGTADASFTVGENWFKHSDGYYYYTKAVAPNEATGNLLNSNTNIDLTNRQVTVLAEAIQADGTKDGVKAVENAWGVDPTTLTVKGGATE